MAGVPSTREWVAGETVSAGLMNSYVTTPDAWMLGGRPLFRAVQTVSQVIANTSWTSVTWATEQIDRDGGHSTSVNTSRYTAQTAGWYDASGTVTFDMTPVVGVVAARLAVNGTAVTGAIDWNGKTDSNFQSASVHDLVYLGVGDYLEFQVWHSAGDFWGTQVSGEVAPRLCLRWDSS